MTRWWLIAIVATGCGRLDFTPGADAAVDSDNDSDAAPPCAGLDEDGDSIANPCDTCPHVNDVTNRDGDGDGVGDVCDPEPASARQRLRFFDGFDSALPEWELGAPAMLAGGQLAIPLGTGTTVTTLNIGGPSYLFEMSGEIVAVGPAPQQMFISIENAIDDEYYVELIQAGTGRRRSLMRNMGTVYTELDGVTDPTTPIAPAPFLMRLGFLDGNGSARVRVGTDVADLAAPGIGPANTATTYFYLQNLSIVLDYTIVIETL